MKVTASRYHDFSYGHTVSNHESKCRHLHGHNGRVHFTVEAEELDSVGRVMDFSVIKSTLCEWVETNWDHKFLIYKDDARKDRLEELDHESMVVVDFNPTAENMAKYLLTVKGPEILAGTNVKLVSVVIEETRKCQVQVSTD